MPRVFGVLLLVLVAALSPSASVRAGDGVFEPFDARTLDATEVRLVQVALAAEGDHRGPLDGVWGTLSQQALDAWTDREFGEPALNGHAAALVLGFLEAVEMEGWDFRPLPDAGVSMALPFARLGPTEPEEGGQRRWSRHGSLTVLVHRFDDREARGWHDAAQGAGTDPTTAASRREPDLMITEGTLRDGRGFFTRSDRVDGAWTTVYLASGEDEAALMDLAAASIYPGPPPDWRLPADGRLGRLVEATAALIAAPVEQPAPLPVAASPGATAVPGDGGIGPGSTGTGFYLGPTALVTAAHVVASCTRVSLADGTGLALIDADPDLDVAVLAAPRPAAAWLTLAAGGHARLGQRVHAAGFPYYAIAGTSLHLTTGNVSALAGVDDDPRFFSFSAPVQPGNSGGPLIDARGEVLGLVVARLSEDFIIEATGTLPQNVNYALAEDELEAFLRLAAIDLKPGGLGGFAMDEGAPPGLESAVVPLICE